MSEKTKEKDGVGDKMNSMARCDHCDNDKTTGAPRSLDGLVGGGEIGRITYRACEDCALLLDNECSVGWETVESQLVCDLANDKVLCSYFRPNDQDEFTETGDKR